MVPMSPAKMTGTVSAAGSTTPVAMVAATWVPKIRNATKLKKAAQITAKRGVSTLVETTVAIELAASWKPLT
jgi:fructose-specific phosphotransferase system IIC component